LRTLTTAAKNAFAQLNFPSLVLVELDFADGIVRLCNAAYSFTWGTHTETIEGVETAVPNVWIGLGTLGKIEAISEGSALQMYGCALTLSGVPSETIALALGTTYQGRPATIWLAPLTADYAFIADPVVVFKGRMDTMDVEIGATSTVTVAVESRLVDWERARIRRFNDEDQRGEFPTDRGFRYVDQMVQKDLKWGRI
jgi:hypothetical protein